MGKLEDYIAKLKQLTPEVQEQALLGIIASNEAALVDYNIRQMMEGKRADDSDISPEYSPITVEIKRHKGQPYDKVTLRDEGEFQQKMYADTKKFPVEFDSMSFKTPKLVEQYGEKIFGVSKNNKREFVEQDIKDDIQAFYNKALSI